MYLVFTQERNEKFKQSSFALLSLASHSDPAFEDEVNLGLVIVLVLFSVVILTTVLSLVYVMW